MRILTKFVVLVVLMLCGCVGGCADSHSTRGPRLNWESHTRLDINTGESEGTIALSGNTGVLKKIVDKDNEAPDYTPVSRSAVTSDGATPLKEEFENGRRKDSSDCKKKNLVSRTETALGMRGGNNE